jgi:exopolysaccharide biosynthesis polyprenyl glycosylphosphotransferase
LPDIANIVDFQPGRRPKTATVAFPPTDVGYSDLARLIPGTGKSFFVRTQSFGKKVPISTALSPRGYVRNIAAEFLPRFCQKFEAKMLAPAILDAALIILVFASEAWLLRPRALPLATVFVYVAAFLSLAIEEGLYSGNNTPLGQHGAACRAVALAALFASLSLGPSHIPGSVFAMVALSLCSLGVLATARTVRRALPPASNHVRNVLIVGSGIKAKHVSDAIERDPSSLRLVKGYMAENHLRNVYGGAMLSRIAREEFVDEIIVASADVKVVETAIKEACLNKLDVKLAPEICIQSAGAEFAFENVGGIPLLKIRDHRPPEFCLALKRSLDFGVALCGAMALSPLFLLIAALIKLDSQGPVLYRAARTGRKGRRFVCYKFRTMVPEAEAIKDVLRARNEREGAFFKITNDPRITRIGRLLRRYSLDELPQLWNVVLGEMSLVGPRPHPPDDVSHYKIEHLRRLDFVPGITGLWQVTARRDPSFERSVALDVEYIKNWNLWLDLRILCKTVSAVLQGSGA